MKEISSAGALYIKGIPKVKTDSWLKKRKNITYLITTLLVEQHLTLPGLLISKDIRSQILLSLNLANKDPTWRSGQVGKWRVEKPIAGSEGDFKSRSSAQYEAVTVIRQSGLSIGAKTRILAKFMGEKTTTTIKSDITELQRIKKNLFRASGCL